jgi:hypothetical protein
MKTNEQERIIEITAPLVYLILLLLTFSVFSLVSKGLYNPFFRVRFWLNADTWQNNEQIVFDATMPPCTKFSSNFVSGSLHIVGSCNSSISGLPPYPRDSIETLQERLGSIKGILSSPDSSKIAVVTRTVQKIVPVHQEKLHIVEVSTGEIIHEVKPTNLLKLVEVKFLFFHTTIGTLEKFTVLLFAVFVALNALNVWQAVKQQLNLRTIALSVVLPVSVLVLCYGISLIAYGLKWSGS